MFFSFSLRFLGYVETKTRWLDLVFYESIISSFKTVKSPKADLRPRTIFSVHQITLMSLKVTLIKCRLLRVAWPVFVPVQFKFLCCMLGINWSPADPDLSVDRTMWTAAAFSSLLLVGLLHQVSSYISRVMPGKVNVPCFMTKGLKMLKVITKIFFIWELH